MNLKIKTFVAMVILTQGCATLHNGRHQEVRVVTDPPGATVEVRCGEPQPVAVTPTTVRLPRRVEQCSLILPRAGFHSETVVSDSSLSGWCGETSPRRWPAQRAALRGNRTRHSSISHSVHFSAEPDSAATP